MKLVIEEPDSKQARAVLDDFLKKDYSFCTVDIALAECLNAVWKQATVHKDIKHEQAKRATQDTVRIFSKMTVLPTSDLAEEATRIALAQNTTAYDGLYVAAAQKLNATLFTADKKLHDTLKTRNKILLRA